MYSRALCVAMVFALLLLACGLASAQGLEVVKGLSLGVAVFHPTDSTADDIIGNAYGLIMDKQLKSGFGTQLSMSMGWIRHESNWSGENITQDNIPIMLNAKFTGLSKFYVGAGAGIAYTHLNRSVPELADGTSTTNFCYQLFAGTKFGLADKFYAEARYMDGSQAGNTGLLFSIGATF